MFNRQYMPGDKVNLVAGLYGQARIGPFEIMRLMPPRDYGEDQFRVRGADGMERIVGYHEIIDEQGDAPIAAGGAEAAGTEARRSI